ncbi:hypothetical protein [Amycolatopsis sp. NPDC051128]|uniref:hypothetical protein n=1 Tax=Amycolatopsis sp. NPDC051128 TaxID=3155412 RepID=UPI00342CD76E
MAAAARRGSTAKPAAEHAAAVEEESVAPAELAGAALGRIAYEAYCEAVDGQSVGGDELPAWDALAAEKTDVAAAWCAAAQAVLTATFERKQA